MDLHRYAEATSHPHDEAEFRSLGLGQGHALRSLHGVEDYR